MPVPIPNLQQLQINPPQPATMRMQGMQMQNQLEQLGIAKDRNAIAREGQALDKERFEFAKMQNNLAMARDFMPTIAPEEMDKVKDHLRGIGLDSVLVDMLPSTKKAIEMPPDKFKDTIDRLTMGTDNFLKMKKEEADAFISSIKEQVKRQQKLADEEKKRIQSIKDQKDKEVRAEAMKIREEKRKTTTSGSYDKNLLVAAQAAEIDPEKVKSGNLSKEEAIAVAEAYREQFGTENLIKMLFGAGLATGSSAQQEPVIQFDESGELITGESPEEKTIIRNKMPAQ